MSDPNVYLGTRNCHDVSVTDLGVDNTGAADAGAQLTTALARFTSGQTAWFPAGSYKITTAVANPNLVAFAFAQGVVFTGANASTVTSAAAGNTVRGDTPALYPATSTSQISHETVTLWQIAPSTETPYQMCLESFHFNSTWDNVLKYGFNVNTALSATQPSAYRTIEQDFEVSPGVHTIEAHMEINDPALRAGAYRPWTCNYKVGVGTLVAGFQYSDLGGAGEVTILEASTAAIQVAWLTGQMQLQPNNYVIVATNGLTIESSSAGSAIEVLAGSTDAVTVDSTNHRTYFFQNSVNVAAISGAGFVFFATAPAATITMATATADVATLPLILQSQAPFAGATGTHRTPAGPVLAVPASVGGAPDGTASFSVAGSTYGFFGREFGGGTLWLTAAATSPVAGNYILNGDGATYAQLNAPVGGTTQLCIAGGTKGQRDGRLDDHQHPRGLRGSDHHRRRHRGCAAGGLPVLPLGYLSTTVNGVAVKIPYYSP